MSLFETYLRLGFEHIINIHGYDHIVFVLVLCAAYSIEQIGRVLLLITAFTVGHSLTLALSTLNIVSIPSDIVEFLIPATILVTAVSNVIQFKKGNHRIVYVSTLFFGLIHGLGFSNYLKEMLGREANILTPLLAFNIGLEIGQMVILAAYFLILLLSTKIFKVRHDFWRIYVSGAGFGIAAILLIENKFW